MDSVSTPSRRWTLSIFLEKEGASLRILRMSSWTFNVVVPPLLVLFVGWLGFSSTRSAPKTKPEFFYPSKPLPIRVKRRISAASVPKTPSQSEDQSPQPPTDLPPSNLTASTSLDKSYIFVPPSPDSEEDELRFGRAPPTPSSKRSESESPEDPSANEKRSEDGLEELTIRSFLERFVPSLYAPQGFKPIWWLPNGHLQTIYTAFGDFSKTEKVRYERYVP